MISLFSFIERRREKLKMISFLIKKFRRGSKFSSCSHEWYITGKYVDCNDADIWNVVNLRCSKCCTTLRNVRENVAMDMVEETKRERGSFINERI